MIKKIENDGGTYFLLQNDSLAYLMRVRGGKLEQLHFGRPIAQEDCAALTYPPNLGWGGSTLYEENDPSSCMDTVPLAWSGSGFGDYRESPVELQVEGKPLASDFVLKDAAISDGIIPISSGLPGASGGSETLMVRMACRGVSGLQLRLYFSLYPTALTRRAVLVNETAKSVVVTKLMSVLLDLPGDFEITTFDGGWIAEAHAHKTAVSRQRVVNESTAGFSSSRHNPGFLLTRPNTTEFHGEAYGFNLIYSGNHYASAQTSQQNLTRVMQGISPDHFAWEVKPGDSFETPEAVLCWSENGCNGLSRNMHRFVNENIIPHAWQYENRPVVFNNWEGCMFGFSESKLLFLARRAKRLGCELFVLDDGWFGQRNSDRAGLGDYSVNRKKLPDGLEGLSRKIHNLGMDFGLWFEPEAVNPDSELYRAHPDWALHTDGVPDLYGRHELLLDLTKSEVRDYIVDSVSNILDSADIQYVKWDMNRQSPLLGAEAHAYIVGLCDVLRRIFGPRPEILLESCSSGGNRFDLGMLCFFPQIWTSDDTDPIERLDIQQGLSYLYPQSTMSAHIAAAPHAQTLRKTPLSTRANVAFFGVLGLELDLSHLLPVEETELASQIQFYKAHRETFQFGEFCRNDAEKGAVCWQVAGDRKSVVGLFHRLVPAAPGYEWLRVGGLHGAKCYRVTCCPQLLRVGEFGRLIGHISPVPIDPNGVVLRTADHRYKMADAAQSFTASGDALMSGVPINQRFTGTGYDKRLRMQGDFGSNLYLIEEEPV